MWGWSFICEASFFFFFFFFFFFPSVSPSLTTGFLLYFFWERVKSIINSISYAVLVVRLYTILFL